MRILCIIPARSGSKGIPDKNIKQLDGKPLLAHSIEQAKQSSYIDQMKVVVSTDSENYANIARTHGAEVPFLRPSEISGDLATDDQFILHMLNNLNDDFDLILQLRPTQPKRSTHDIDNCLKIMIEKLEYTSLRSVIPIEKSPFKMYTIKDRKLLPLYPDKCNMPRQALDTCYLHNGYIDIVRVNIIKKLGSLLGDNIYPYVMKDTDTVDIGEEKDWPIRETFLEKGYIIFDNMFSSSEINEMKNEVIHFIETDKTIKNSDGITIPDFLIHNKKFLKCSKLINDSRIHDKLNKIFGSNNYRFCSHNDIGINRVVGWHKDKLNGEYARYETVDIFTNEHEIVKVALYLEDHSNDTNSLQLVPGSHRNRNININGSIHLQPKLGSVIIFDQRLTHRGMEKQASSYRIMISMGFGKNNIITDNFERGTIERQNKQNKIA